MSNLLDSASIVLTPTAYDNGKMLSVKPSVALGAELVISTTNSLTGWIDARSNASLSIVDDNIRATYNSGTTMGFSTAITTIIGKKYSIKVNGTRNNTAGAFYVRLSASSNLTTPVFELQNNLDSISVDATFVATQTTHYVGLLATAQASGNYIQGSLVSVKEDLSGDFDFSRNSAATRVNAQGLVENVQILSGDLVSNGDFSQEGVQEVSNGSFSQEGAEQVTNGDFATDTDWTTLGGWSIANGKAICDGGSIMFTNASMQSSKIYKITYTISDYVSGGFRIIINGTPDAFGETRNGNGTYTEYVQSASSVNGNFSLGVVSSFNGSIDNVSVKEVGQDWVLGGSGSNKATIGDNSATITSVDGNSYLQQNSVLTSGKNYKISYEIISSSAATNVLKLISSFGISEIPTSVGTHIIYGIAASSILYIERYSNGVNATITNISVKEVGQDWDVNGGSYASFANNVLNSNNTQNGNWFAENISQNISFVNGKKYKLTFKAKNISGNLNLRLTQGANVIVSSTLTSSFVDYEVFYTANADNGALKIFCNDNVGQFEITNISVIEITDDTNLPRINYEGFSYQDSLGPELVTNGDFATDTNWVKGTGWIISGGSANANNSTRDLYQENVVESGKYYKVTYTISNYVSGSVRVEIPSNAYDGALRTANGTYTEILLSGGTIILFDGRTAFNGSIDNVSVKEVLGQEVVPDSGCGSWLLEPQSTNLLPFSEDFSGSNWTTFQSSIASNQYNALTNKNDATLFYPSSTSTYASIFDTDDLTSGIYTFSVFAKANGKDFLCIDDTFGGKNWFNLSNGTLGTISSSYTAKIENYGDWYRCSVTNNSNTFFQYKAIYLVTDADNTTAITKNGTDGILLFGSQTEQQSYSTSYIPTNGATTTRLQDIANNSGNATLFNSTEGVLYAEIEALANDGTFRGFTISANGNSSNRVTITINSTANSIRANVKSNNATSFDESYNSVDVLSNTKIAMKYAQDNFALFINGVKRFSDTSGNTPVGLDVLNFNAGSTALPFHGKVKALVVYKEALTDEQLTCLTTI